MDLSGLKIVIESLFEVLKMILGLIPDFFNMLIEIVSQLF